MEGIPQRRIRTKYSGKRSDWAVQPEVDTAACPGSGNMKLDMDDMELRFWGEVAWQHNAKACQVLQGYVRRSRWTGGAAGQLSRLRLRLHLPSVWPSRGRVFRAAGQQGKQGSRGAAGCPSVRLSCRLRQARRPGKRRAGSRTLSGPLLLCWPVTLWHSGTRNWHPAAHEAPPPRSGWTVALDSRNGGLL